MYLWQHAAVSLVISYVVVAYLGLDIQTGMFWIVLGVICGTLIDLDHFLYSVMVRGKSAMKIILREKYMPSKLFAEFYEGGKLHYPSRSRTIFHAIISLLVYSLTLNLFPQYSLIVGINLLAHQICDIDVRWFKWKGY
ncbi:MAG: hypothetical protein QW472_00825 [Candidatus Aenigmatarchaeota archaeon]